MEDNSILPILTGDQLDDWSNRYLWGITSPEPSWAELATELDDSVYEDIPDPQETRSTNWHRPSQIEMGQEIGRWLENNETARWLENKEEHEQAW